ncbi:hypothetical protein [Clostridium algidicarnis]|uniref:hypothetical protein n=1 Tax=Clostridium algidicarnis TaxID=37659 RepID=UPI001C0BF530|nr:hypothetical protein [Clostridium algidicarnis]MBU3192440.1 hypothetical protein [Clostridium algidicarnis]MBU3206460.1 hypothetical protein [Clostridium algidicarnis]
MAFPAITPVLTDEESINVILESEVSIVQCMADLFCNTLVPDLKDEEDIDKKLRLFKDIMCGYTAKENSIAAVVRASAKKRAADLGIDPREICDCKFKKDC